MSFQLQSSSPRQARELYSPPPPLDSENPVPTEEDSSASSEVHYRSDIYTPPAELRFVDRGPTVTISWPTPAAGGTREPETPPRSRFRSICNNQVIGASLVIGGLIDFAIDAAVIFRIEPFTTAVAAGVVVAVVGVVAIGIGTYFMQRTDD